MPKIPTRAELIALAEAEIRRKLDPSGTGKVNLRAGSRNSVMVSVSTLLALRLGSAVADRVAARSPANAKGDDLTDIGRDIFFAAKRDARAATGRAYFTRSGTLPSTSLPKGTRVATKQAGTTPPVTFELTETVSVLAGATTANAAIQCQQTGEIGNVDLANITEILDPLPDTAWSLTVPGSPEDLGGGSSEETDEEFSSRLLQMSNIDAQQAGTLRAINTGAGNVPGVKYWTAVEPTDGTVLLYIGDASYSLPVALQNEIQTELENWRCFGVPVVLRRYNAQTVQVTGTLYMQRGLKSYAQDTIVSAAIDAVKKYFATGRTQPDEYFVNKIEAAIESVHPETQTAVLSLPSADVKRPTDSGYGTVTALNRYIVDDSSINISIAGPLTA